MQWSVSVVVGYRAEDTVAALQARGETPDWPRQPDGSAPDRVVGLDRAAASIGMPGARPHVFVASGTYAETVELPDGVFVHGGYRRDFLALDPDGFRTIVRAPGASWMES